MNETNEWMNEWTDRVYEWMNDWMCEMNEWMKWMTGWMNDYNEMKCSNENAKQISCYLTDFLQLKCMQASPKVHKNIIGKLCSQKWGIHRTKWYCKTLASVGKCLRVQEMYNINWFWAKMVSGNSFIDRTRGPKRHPHNRYGRIMQPEMGYPQNEIRFQNTNQCW